MKRLQILLSIHVLLFITVAVLLSLRIEKKFGRWHGENLLYIPKSTFLKHMTFGYDQLVADLLWFKTITYFGEHMTSDRQYTWLPNLMEAITTLDPEWIYPYHFAGVILGTQGGMVEESNRIVKRGMDLHPEVWQFPFYIGFNFFHLKKDPRCGAQFIYKASVTEGSPVYLKSLAVRLSSAGDTPENHAEMCNQLMALVRDPAIQREIKKKCTEDIKEKSAQKFHAQFKGYQRTEGPCL